MIDHDLVVFLSVSGVLALLLVSLVCVFFRGIRRIKALDWVAGILALVGMIFLGLWYIGFSQPAGDYFEAVCIIVAMMFALTALCVWIWRVVEEFRIPD